MFNVSLLLVVAGIVFFVGAGLALWRFSSLHSKGTQVIIRPLPASDGAAWRHGVMLYTDSCLKVYKLRSLRPGVDLELARHDVEILSRREPTDIETSFFNRGIKVVKIDTATQGEWELALDSRGDTALVAWVESSPSIRQTRALPTNIEKRFKVMGDRDRR